MEQCFRIALWMFLLVGYLQAQPIGSKEAKSPCFMNLRDLAFRLLEDVSCSNTTNFTSPVVKSKECHVAALQLFIKGMKDAENICTQKVRIEQTREALEYACPNEKMTECNFTMKTHEQFQQFVQETEKFVVEWNDHQSSKQ